MVPHHGAATNGNPNVCFYDLVQPAYAIVSSAIQCSRKHPKMETLQAICRVNTETVTPDLPDNYNPNNELRPLGSANTKPYELSELTKCDVMIYQTSVAVGSGNRRQINYYNIELQLTAFDTQISTSLYKTLDKSIYDEDCDCDCEIEDCD